MVCGKFDDQYNPTIEDSCRTQVMIHEESCTIELLDISGCEEYDYLQKRAVHQAEGFVVVYNITSQSSFQRAQEIQQEIQQAKNYAAMGPVVLVGNMTDLKDGRKVAKKAGRSEAAEFDFHFEEVCAKDRSDVQDIFKHVVRRLCSREQPRFHLIATMHKLRRMFSFLC